MDGGLAHMGEGEPDRRGDSHVDTMQGVEARGKRRQYKEYKRTRDAETFAKKLGIHAVNYGGRVDIANLANRALYEAGGRGVPLQTSILVRAFDQEDDDPSEIAYYVPALTGGCGEIVINAGHSFWANPKEVAREAREGQELSTDSPLHPLMHELGELALHQSVGDDRFDQSSAASQRAEEEFQKEDLSHIFETLGDRATANHLEFVAEAFAAIQLGRANELRQDQAIMRMYERYGGSAIRHYDL